IAGGAGNENVLHRSLQFKRAAREQRAFAWPHPCTFGRGGRCFGRCTRGEMPHKTDVTQRLGQFVVETKWDALKPPVVHQAKRALVNFFAVALTGCREPAIETALQSLTAFSGGRQATMIGRGERLDALSTAFLNAASANVLDFCDTHVPTVIHPTAPVAPSLFAL